MLAFILMAGGVTSMLATTQVGNPSAPRIVREMPERVFAPMLFGGLASAIVGMAIAGTSEPSRPGEP
jgi:hypothetical protein